MEHRNQKQNILCMRTQFMTDTGDQNLLRKELISLWIHCASSHYMKIIM